MFILPFIGLKSSYQVLFHISSQVFAAGVFGNATGGRIGAMSGAFANGLLISFIPAILLIFMGDIGYEGTTFGDSDFGVIGIIIINLLKLFGAV